MKLKGIAMGVLASSIVLTACGNEKKNDTETPKVEAVKELKDGKVVLKDLDIKIVKSTLRPSDKQLVIEYTVKNKSSKEMTPQSAWAAVFEVNQTVKNSRHDLAVGTIPTDGQYADIENNLGENIGKGKMVKGVVAYNLEDNKAPVVITAYDGRGGKILGQKVIGIK